MLRLGQVGSHLSEETKRKISEKAKARFADPDRLAKQRALLDSIRPTPQELGERSHRQMSTPEAKAALSARMLAHWADPEKRAAHVEASRIGARKPERRQRLSEYKRAWHAAKTPQERHDHMMPAVVASQL